ncbi:type II CAAX prenyl endopeptidase Rce1 family protein [Parasphingorhabdus sp.]|uniref:CPBP family glutamic-type intramembrane protease n=1 Tax=Parasphingorhabdus sp. TaxID=2709688 RepID=UPI00359336B0
MVVPIKQTWRALKVWPAAGRWKAIAALALPTMAIIALAGYLGGWLYLDPVTDLPSALIAALILFFVPALAEELVFRGVLLSWFARFSQRLGNWLSILLFVLWHPVQALAFGPPWAAIFLQPSFLFATFILAIVLTHIRIASQSLWPVILIHWLLVVLWKLLFGGPFY